MARTATQPFRPKSCSSSSPHTSSCRARTGARTRRSVAASQPLPPNRLATRREQSSPSTRPDALLISQDRTAITSVTPIDALRLPSKNGSREGCNAEPQNCSTSPTPPACRSVSSRTITGTSRTPGRSGRSGAGTLPSDRLRLRCRAMSGPRLSPLPVACPTPGLLDGGPEHGRTVGSIPADAG